MKIFDEEFVNKVANKTLNAANEVLDVIDKKLKENEEKQNKKEDTSTKTVEESNEEVQNNGYVNTDDIDWHDFINSFKEDEDLGPHFEDAPDGVEKNDEEEDSKEKTTNFTDYILNSENMKKLFDDTKEVAGRVVDSTKETYNKVKKANDTRKKVSSTVKSAKEKGKKAAEVANEKLNTLNTYLNDKVTDFMNNVMEEPKSQDNTKEEDFTEVTDFTEEKVNNEVKQAVSMDDKLNVLKLRSLQRIEELIKSNDANTKEQLEKELENLDFIKKVEALKDIYPENQEKYIYAGTFGIVRTIYEGSFKTLTCLVEPDSEDALYALYYDSKGSEVMISISEKEVFEITHDVIYPNKTTEKSKK